MKLQKLIEKNTPFAVMEYFDTMKKTDYVNKKYEILTVKNEIVISKESKKEERLNVLRGSVIPFTEVKEVLDTLTLKVSNKSGRVWEFNNFKQYYASKMEENLIKKK